MEKRRGKNMIFSRKLSLLIGISFLSIFEAGAMEEDPDRKTPPQTFHIIVPQEQVDLMNRRQYIASTYPRLASFLPIIISPDEFQIAKEYLYLSLQHDGLLYKAMITSAAQNISPQLFTLSQQTLQEMEMYQAMLYGPHYQTFRSAKDEEELKKYYYDIHYRLAENQLVLLIPKVLTFGCRGDNPQIDPHLQEIKRLEALIHESPEHRKKLKATIRTSEKNVPALRLLFHPNEVRLTLQPHRSPSKKIQTYKIAKYNEELIKTVTQGLSGLQEDVPENFDIHFELKMREILTQNLELSTKKVSPTEYVDTMEKLTEELVVLEKRGIKFKALLSRFPVSPQTEGLTIEELTNLYQFFSKRYTLPQKNPLRLLEHSIFMFIHANKVGDALIRTEVLKNLLPESAAQSDNFKVLRANVLALNGDFDEWRGILTKKREAAEKEKSHQKQKIVKNIKKQQEEIQQQKAKEEEKKKALITKKVPRPQSMPESQDDFQVFPENCSSSIKEQHAIVAPREKVKTRKPATEPTVQGTVSLTETSPLPIQSPKDYPVSQKALKTYCKIREGNWHFPRKDLYNLFDKLGCRIDIEQGKGDHGTIHLPLTMTIHNTEGIVAVLPEFMQKEASNTPLRPLTIPNWDEKWDGRVPPYMRRSILSALDYLGATDETVHK